MKKFGSQVIENAVHVNVMELIRVLTFRNINIVLSQDERKVTNDISEWNKQNY